MPPVIQSMPAQQPGLSHRALEDGRIEVIYDLAAGSTDVFVGIWAQHAFFLRTLVEKPSVSAGRHSVIWDGKDENGDPAGPGVFITRMSVGQTSGASDMFVAGR